MQSLEISVLFPHLAPLTSCKKLHWKFQVLLLLGEECVWIRACVCIRTNTVCVNIAFCSRMVQFHSTSFQSIFQYTNLTSLQVNLDLFKSFKRSPAWKVKCALWMMRWRFAKILGKGIWYGCEVQVLFDSREAHKSGLALTTQTASIWRKWPTVAPYGDYEVVTSQSHGLWGDTTCPQNRRLRSCWHYWLRVAKLYSLVIKVEHLSSAPCTNRKN